MAEEYALLSEQDDCADAGDGRPASRTSHPLGRWCQRAAARRSCFWAAVASCFVGFVVICAALLIGFFSKEASRAASTSTSASPSPSALSPTNAHGDASDLPGELPDAGGLGPTLVSHCRIGGLQYTNCHPEAGATEARCIVRNCTWCEDAALGGHRCVRTADKQRLVSNSNEDDACETKLPRDLRVDCHPDPGCNEASCLNRGCNWCVTNTTGIPSCFYDLGLPMLDSEQERAPFCAESADVNRIDCLPHRSGTVSPAQECAALGCQWCPSSIPGFPWCYHRTEHWSTGKEPAQRVNCLPEGGGSGGVDTCLNRGCLLGRTEGKAPACYFPDAYGYRVLRREQISGHDVRVQLEKAGGATLFGGTMKRVAVTFEYQTDSRLRVKFMDMSEKEPRFEVPLKIPVEQENGSRRTAGWLYEVTVSEEPVFSFKVVRRSTGDVLFDTSLGGLTLEHQFIQVATRLPSANIYGLGESEHHSFKHRMDWQVWGMYARDQPPMFKANSYGVHPFYTVLENSGSSHGVLFLNSAAQDFTLTPAPGLVYRTIGGLLDIYFFLGPSPESVVQQYTLAIGRPVMPSYWSLGFQLCRYGYNNISAMHAAVDRMRRYDIPHDVQYGDIDTMWENHDFTYDATRFPGLPAYVQQLKQEGTRYVTILDPCIDSVRLVGSAYSEVMKPLEQGNDANVWVKLSDGITNAKGKVWPPNDVFFPDFTLPRTRTWWIDQAVKFHQVINFDGLWIDMNEPSNFVSGSSKGCSRNSINYPPFVPAIFNRTLHYKTLCPDYRHHLGRHYDVHNLYGWSETEPTQGAVHGATGNRGMVLSRSTYPGSGKYGGHWLGDNFSLWSNLHYSIIGMLEFNLFGIPFVGADICGFQGNTTREMCQRWMQLGAFYPFSRNHNDIGQMDQDPGVFGPAVAASSRAALTVRYTLLPYLYTLFYHAHVDGSTVIRALFHEFPTDLLASNIDRQFLWGPAFMVSPVLEQGATRVWAYFPGARWFSYYTGLEVSASADGSRNLTVDAPPDFIPLHIRDGHILPTQEPANCTMLSRQNPLGLLVALDASGAARGDLFWDDGEAIGSIEAGAYSYLEFSASTSKHNTTTLTIMASHVGGPQMPQLQQIRIYGLKAAISNITVNDSPLNDFSHNSTTMVTVISNSNITLPTAGHQSIAIKWSSLLLSL